MTQTQATQLPGAPPFKVQIADDHGLFRRGIRDLLAGEPNLEICSESTNGTETIEHVREHHPDMLLLDLTMPEQNGLEVAAVVHEESPTTRIIILSMHFSEEVARQALRAGALGYMLKSDADRDLLAGIRHVRNHRTFFTGALASKLISSFMEAEPAPAEAQEQEVDCPLTDREIEILRLLATGESNKKVGASIGVSTRTVESHRNHIMHKMNFSNFSDLVRFATRNGLIAP